MISLSMAACMAVSVWVTACGQKQEIPSNTSDNATEKTTDNAGSSTEEKSQEVPVQELEPVALKWYLRGAKPKDADAVIQKANALTESAIRTTVEYVFTAPGEYDQKMQLIMASNEEFDICFTSNWANNYINNVSKGAYIPVDEYLEKYPALKDVVGDVIWDGIKVNGKIYGIPNNQIMANQRGVWMQKALVDKYSIKLEDIQTFTDLTPIFSLIKEKEPTVTPFKYGVAEGVADELSESGMLSKVEGFVINTDTWTVESHILKHENYIEGAKLMREWYQKGFFPSNVATAAEGDLAITTSGKLFGEYSKQKPGGAAEKTANFGFEVVEIPIGLSVMNSSGIQSAISSISRTSKNPERAIMLLELMNTEPDLINTLTFGVEGQDYNKVGENRIEKLPDTYAFNGWQLGNVFNTYLLPGQPDNVWDDTKKLNEQAIPDPLIDFAFNREPVQNELAQLNAVFKEMNTILKNGLEDYEKMSKTVEEKVKAAGEDKIIAEIQKQLDEWRKSKN